MRPYATAWTATSVILLPHSPKSSRPLWKLPRGKLRVWWSCTYLQAESEISAINMVYGGAACGKYAMTSSSSPGISLKQEGISYMAGAELPALIVNVQRGGPGLGTIQPSQADYFQTVKGGGHGDYKLITLAPSSVQEMADFVGLAFDLAFKYL